MPQTIAYDAAIDSFLVSIDTIEQRAWFDFFPELGQQAQHNVEHGPAPAIWTESRQ